jgi:hypothetical protein
MGCSPRQYDRDQNFDSLQIARDASRDQSLNQTLNAIFGRRIDSSGAVNQTVH